MLLEEFFSDDKALKAQILELNYVFKVILFNNDRVVEVKEFKGKTIDYVRDYCENYVLKVMQY